MIKFIIALVIVLAVVLGGLMSFRRNKRLGQPSQDVIDRVKVREQEIQAKERAEGDY
ncbi:MAG: hypothetical protein ABIT36_02690 [Steroidobacteraceae bacterium]